MSDWFYDGQMRRYLTQFIRVMSNFSYKDAKGQLVQVPARYGDMTRQVAQILSKNSENVMPSAPFIACYIKEIKFDRPRIQDPTFVDSKHMRERAVDPVTGNYIYSQGSSYTVERIMPSPYKVTFVADIWTSNTEQKLQIWEQIAVLFNPSMDLQTSNNYLDWTSLTVLELDNMVWSSRNIPQGVDQNIDILTMTFNTPVWITPPAKVKQMGIITKIISSVIAVPTGSIAVDYSDPNAVYDFNTNDSRLVVSPQNFNLLVLNNSAILVKTDIEQYSVDIENISGKYNWYELLDLYPGQFRAGLSQIRLQKPNGQDIVAYISLDPTDDTRMVLNIDNDTIPANSIINGRSTVDAIINPETFNPTSRPVGATYLILEDINPGFGSENFIGVEAWKNGDGSDFTANANDIIIWDGYFWNVIFDSVNITEVTYITNIYTGIQYKWQNGAWAKSYEGLYDKSLWRIIL